MNSVRPNCPYCGKAGLTGWLHRDGDHGYVTECTICGKWSFVDNRIEKAKKIRTEEE